ncbi:hydrolase 1, exosortase A system-associated [Sphingomonas sp. UV9]|uniref:hydrolase 1, exosortase A system-associated n=1 Tax=Sphingomonas sp. UV9 TaxID=1851410 RepID=UPI000FFC8C3F|nr:hydrolase 1, exosortase A system-associated [Sphingomonas sp. UV9]RXD07105.1 hydrolase 1, exosortase A system-associated [Sphingomonas sp. UV9]
MRKLIAFACEGETLAATLDEAAGTTGLLIVSGGNEIRSGAHRGMALLAQRLAATGTPVFRYDRRGVGDSTGDNDGFLSAQPDLIAAAAAFRQAAPHVTRLIGFGNCDAASTLALFGRSAGIDRVVLANPWVVEPIDELPPAAAIRARYHAALRDPATWRRAVMGKIDFANFIRGLKKLSHPKNQEKNSLSARVLTALAAWKSDATVILASGDATAIAFAAAAGKAVAVETIETASHSFTGEAGTALETAIRRTLA